MNATIEAPEVQSEISLKDRWQLLMSEQPNLRIRNAAALLGVSEMELMMCREEGALTPLTNDFGALITELESVGEVMMLARNDEMVHEITGHLKGFKVTGGGSMGLSVGEMDLRVFFRSWAFGFQVVEEVRSGTRHSLQFFDASGRAIQKVYKTAGTDAEAWDALVAKYQADQPVTPELKSAPSPEPRVDPASVDVSALQQDWATLKDVHHFHAMLKRNKVDRLTAVELVGPAYTRKLMGSTDSIESPLDELLLQVKTNQCPIMVFVGNPGIVQIWTGQVDNIRRVGEWMNVLDPGFNLHAKTGDVTDWWTVKRPSVDGTITSLEGYNANGEIVLTVFGKRKPGQTESADWQAEVRVLEAKLCG
ncbi:MULTISPECIES: hemin-degrading factor [unclassified Marinobacter]|uniref:hemin-degrading factor n=1 Tax=unclassified Marinobacter TaxID=83889 RepID=UPI00190826F5|nr:ChuX/HutX family heme-like substrate-binding protein [Marinobacter sp. 1-3A]MBK1872234.1 hemin-degrading factor [Marinobacter sp. 1-3A]